MAEQNTNIWKFTAIGMALVMAAALVTGLVVANWSGSALELESRASVQPVAPPVRQAERPAPARVASATPPVPTQSAIEACNRQAAAEPPHDKTMEVVKDAAIGAVVGAAVGAAGGAIASGGKGAGQGALIGGAVGVGGGSLYGLNENRKKDERYRAAYAGCMRARGYAG
jgi:Glycine zipper